MQVEYSLAACNIEREHAPVAQEASMAVVPWSTLAGGFLTGKYKRADTGNSGRLSGDNPFGDSKFTDRNWELLEVLRGVAEQHERSLAQIALAWLAARPGVACTVIGARRVEQLHDNLASTDV